MPNNNIWPNTLTSMRHCATILMPAQQTQNICMTFVQCWTNVEDVGPTWYHCFTNVSCLLGVIMVMYYSEWITITVKRPNVFIALAYMFRVGLLFRD